MSSGYNVGVAHWPNFRKFVPTAVGAFLPSAGPVRHCFIRTDTPATYKSTQFVYLNPCSAIACVTSSWL